LTGCCRDFYAPLRFAYGARWFSASPPGKSFPRDMTITSDLPPSSPPPAGSVRAILRYLTIVGVTFLVLVMALEPDMGFTAPPAARLLFWTLQIASGLLVLQSVLFLLTRHLGASRLPSWSLVLLSGLLGAAVLAPVYWLIGEGLMMQWLEFPARPDHDDAVGGGIAFGHPLLQEYVDIVFPVTAAWALMCLPRLHWLVPPLLHEQATSPTLADAPPGDTLMHDTSPETGVVSDLAPSTPGTVSASHQPEPLPATDAVQAQAAQHSPIGAWCERLPAELGRNVIAVASELQYLRVWTPRGCALILGALDDVEADSGTQGLRVHRSWWVAIEHVVSVRRTATGTVCLMSDGRQVPVSRRRRAEVVARLGDGARYLTDGGDQKS
jgi:hypothetical protein